MGRTQVMVAAVLTASGLVAIQAELSAQAAGDAGKKSDPPSMVEVVAEDYAFDAPDEIPSGWTTLRFRNVGEEPHMVFMGRLPEGKTFEDYETDISVAFNRVWEAVRAGEVDMEGAFAMLGEVMPDWLPEFVGGPGIQAAGLTSEVVLELQPGNYVIECYIKNADGEVHYMEGMARPLTVTAERSDAAPPTSDVRVRLSNSGIELEGPLEAGTRTFEVHVAENPEEGFGHSVHVARLDADTKVDDVIAWMNWFAVDGLRAPAPARFIGGTHPMATGGTAYFTVDLEPGRYLMLSEATAPQGVFEEFTVK